MRTIFYISLVISALFLTRSKDLRDSVVFSMKSMFSNVKELSSASDRAEIRNINADEFDEAVSSKSRVVIVVFYDEFSTDAMSKAREFESAVRKLPSEVLLCKVATSRNADLVRRLAIGEVSSMVRFYRNGSVAHSFSGEVTPEQILKLANSYVQLERNGNGGGQITPLNKNWIPSGVDELAIDGGAYTPL